MMTDAEIQARRELGSIIGRKRVLQDLYMRVLNVRDEMIYKGIKYGLEAPGPRGIDHTAEMFDKLTRLEEQYNQQYLEILDLIKAIEGKIWLVTKQDPVLGQILSERYIDGKSIEELCVSISYSYRNLKYLLKKAIILYSTLPPIAPD